VFQVRVVDCPGVSSFDDAASATVGFVVAAVSVVVVGGGVIVIVVDLVADPPVPVQTRVYVVVTDGETVSVPPVLLVPDQPPEAVQAVAPVLLQVRDDCVFPRVRVGADAVTGGGVLVTVTEVLQVAVCPALFVTVPVYAVVTAGVIERDPLGTGVTEPIP
jgi:hypothetical protein